VAPALGQPGDFVLRLLEAEAQRALGETGQAIAALECALKSATSDEQRRDVRTRIARIQEVQPGTSVTKLTGNMGDT
jgi:hypothetical protein